MSRPVQFAIFPRTPNALYGGFGSGRTSWVTDEPMLIFDFCELPLAFAVHVDNGFRRPEALDSRELMELLDAISHDITMKELDVGDDLENTTSDAGQSLNGGRLLKTCGRSGHSE